MSDNALQEDLGSADRVQRDDAAGGLCLKRKPGESITIGSIMVKIVKVTAGGICTLRIVAPRDVPISRVE